MIPLNAPSIDISIRALRYRANYSVNTTCADSQNQVNMRERIAFLKSQPTLPVEVEVTQKSGSRKRTSKKVLDLVPYLENLDVDGNGSVSFTIRRLKTVLEAKESPEPEKTALDNRIEGVGTGSYENASHETLQDSAAGGTDRAQTIAESGLASVKPSWVLDLINPNLKWSLTRTGIDMDTPVEPALAT